MSIKSGLFVAIVGGVATVFVVNAINSFFNEEESETEIVSTAAKIKAAPEKLESTSIDETPVLEATHKEAALKPLENNGADRTTGNQNRNSDTRLIETSTKSDSLSLKNQAGEYLLRFRAIDQNDQSTKDKYQLIVNDEKIIVFDEKTHARSNGERRSDWEMYEFPVELRESQPNHFTFAVISKGMSTLGFDFIELLKNNELVWSYGVEDYSAGEFFRPVNWDEYPMNSSLLSRDINRRSLQLIVDSSKRIQDSTIFPTGILGPNYEGPQSIVIKFEL